MIATDMPHLSPQYAQVMIVQAGAAGQRTITSDATIGICQLVENRQLPSGGPRLSATNTLSPVLALKYYVKSKEGTSPKGPSSVTVLKKPKHGELQNQGTVAMDADTRALTDKGERTYTYVPESGYVGTDSATLLVEMDGKKTKIVYTFHVVKRINQDTEELCPAPPIREIGFTRDSGRRKRTEKRARHDSF